MFLIVTQELVILAPIYNGSVSTTVILPAIITSRISAVRPCNQSTIICRARTALVSIAIVNGNSSHATNMQGDNNLKNARVHN